MDLDVGESSGRMVQAGQTGIDHNRHRLGETSGRRRSQGDSEPEKVWGIFGRKIVSRFEYLDKDGRQYGLAKILALGKAEVASRNAVRSEWHR